MAVTTFSQVGETAGAQPASDLGIGIANNFGFVRTADLDSDGHVDVIYASSREAKVAWYRNLGGTKGFGEAKTISAPIELDVWGIGSLNVADFDGDGAPDLQVGFVTLSHGQPERQEVIWMRNDGGEFMTSKSIPSGRNQTLLTNFVVADFDGDNDVDLLVSEQDGSNPSLLANTGDGTFSPLHCEDGVLEHCEVGISSRMVATADVDDDGNLDVVVDSAGRLQFYRNDGAGSFSPYQQLNDALGNQEFLDVWGRSLRVLDAAIGDINGDDILDVVWASHIAGTASGEYGAAFSNPDGTFKFGGWFGGFTPGLNTFLTRDIGPMAQLELSDTDRDGDLDLLVAEHSRLGPGSASVSSFENLDGHGSYGARQDLVRSESDDQQVFAAFAVDDFDNDGAIDVAAAMTGLTTTQPIEEAHSVITWHKSRLVGDADDSGDVSFADFVALASSFGKQADAAWAEGDFDGNGRVDFADFVALAANFGTQLVRGE